MKPPHFTSRERSIIKSITDYKFPLHFYYLYHFMNTTDLSLLYNGKLQKTTKQEGSGQYCSPEQQ